jgi:hypothetical protein
MEVKADAQLGAHQRGVAEPAAGASEVARKRGGSRLEKRTTLGGKFKPGAIQYSWQELVKFSDHCWVPQYGLASPH